MPSLAAVLATDSWKQSMLAKFKAYIFFSAVGAKK